MRAKTSAHNGAPCYRELPGPSRPAEGFSDGKQPILFALHGSGASANLQRVTLIFAINKYLYYNVI